MVYVYLNPQNDLSLERADVVETEVLSSLNELAQQNFIQLTRKGKKLDQIVQIAD
jgi:hypothetical protein